MLDALVVALCDTFFAAGIMALIRLAVLIVVAIAGWVMPCQNEDMAASEGYLTTEDGVRLFFQKVGSDPKIVMIPNGLYFFDEFARFSGTRTLIFYDVRNRGRSDSVTGPAKARGIAQDVEDLDAMRRHFGIDRMDLIGHSYIGLMIGLYAMKYPQRVNRVVQIGPMPYSAGKQYPTHLTGDADGVLAQVFTRLAQLQKEMEKEDPEERCKKFWSVLRRIYVTDAADAEKIDWGRCELANERNFMRYWTETVFPSIQKLNITAEDFAKAQAPVMIVHGTRDRSAPYGGARDWAMMLPNARLLTVENAAHAPWIESPEQVFSAIDTFLAGAWPTQTEKVKSLER